ncbi:MAG: NERD domain-containing protein [Candidatus Hodarchaeota archaeon]
MNSELILKKLELSLNISEIELEYLLQNKRLDLNQILTFLGNQGYFKEQNNGKTLNLHFRMNLAIYGIVNLKLQPSQVINYLTWQEFEEFCLYVLEQHEFRCIRNFRFKKRKSRFEIDILGFNRPYILCIDAKLWRIRYGKSSALKKAVDNQIIRTEALSNIISKYIDQLQILKWKYVYFIPILITSMNEGIKSHKEVPIVPFYQFNNFISNFNKIIDDLPQFKVKVPKCKVQTKLLF